MPINNTINNDLEFIHTRFHEKTSLDGSTILLTGCAGFLGFYFLHYLCVYAPKLGIRRVIGLDNFKLGKPAWIEALKKISATKLELHEFDIGRADLGEIPHVSEADFVIHMASIASPTFYRKYPIETVDANVWGLRRLLEFYKEKQLKGFLFFSSSEIYGDPDPGSIPTREDYRGLVECVGPRACYDESKRFGETLCYLYNKQYNVPVRIVRPFNNYGPGMNINDRRVPADFAKAILEGRDIQILSDGTPTRTFCYVADAVTGYLKALVYTHFDFFNIGIERPEINIIQLAEIYAHEGRKRMGYDGKVIFEGAQDSEYLTHNPKRRCPNIDKARRLLHFDPVIPVQDGVGFYLEHLKTSGRVA